MDPTQAKVDQYSTNPVAAQPVSATPYAQPYGQPYTGTYVTTGQPTVVSGYATSSVPMGNSVGGNNPLFVSNGRPYPRGTWGDHICDWPQNLFPSCYCVCCVCCGIYLVAQSKPPSPTIPLSPSLSSRLNPSNSLTISSLSSLSSVAQKVGYASFRAVLAVFALACIIGFILTLVGAGAWIVWIPMIFAFCFALGLRIFIAGKENINDCGGCFGECCVGFWCWYCSVAQSKPLLESPPYLTRSFFCLPLQWLVMCMAIQRCWMAMVIQIVQTSTVECKMSKINGLYLKI